MIRYRKALLMLLVLVGLLPFSSVSAAPIPDVQLDVPASVFIGDLLEFTVTFQNNAANDIGYGPFIDLWLPRNGADGAAGTDTPDGITFVSATYLDFPVNSTVLTFPASSGSIIGCVAHPYLRDEDYQPIQVCGTTGDQLVVLELPFGSFAPTQPPVEIVVTANVSDLADLNFPLNIRARGGFRFGQTPVDDPCCDLPIISPEVNATVTPTLLTIAKSNDAPESEIPTGHNFPHRWTITVGVPTGQTITNLDVTDTLPPNVTYVDVVSAVPALSGAPIVNGNTVTFTVASVTGVAGDEDVRIEFEFFAEDVLNPTTGEQEQIYNSVEAVGDWQPNDPRDQGTENNAVAFGECTASSCPGGDAPYLLSLAAQKSVNPLNQPVGAGSTLEYTINFQLSDYYAFADVELTDIISDGQHLDATFQPILSYTQHGATTSTPVNAANLDVLEYWTGGNPGIPANPPAVNGDTVLVLRLSDEVGEPMLGGCIPAGGTADPDCAGFNGGPTTGSLTYRTIVLDQFTDNFPSGDPSVDHGDILSNQLTLAGQLLNPGDFSPNGYAQTNNGSESDIEISRGELTKAIFAVNGTACGACTDVEVSAGDTVTYRITQEMPTSDFETFRLVDYLPLPIYNASEITTFNYTIDATIPPAGSAKLFTNDTLYNLMQAVRPGSPQFPVIQVDPVANSVAFSYGDEFDDPQNRASLIDLLFTVTVTNQPFADGLLLTNIVQSQEESTNAGDNSAETIAQLQVTAPLLLLTKGVVATSNPDGQFSPANAAPVTFNPPGSADAFTEIINSLGLDATTINSNLSGAQAGDIVTFAIVIENVGSNPEGAFDIIIQDILAAGFAIPAGGLNLQVQLGNGVTVSYTALGATGTDTDLFDQGIELIDPGVNGVCGPYSDDSGLNIIVITYDLQITALTDQILQNTAGITNYAASEGGFDYTGNQSVQDTATVTIGAGGTVGGETGTASGLITKSVDLPFAQPGELVTWTIEVWNNSGAALNDVTVTDTLLSELEPINAVTTRGSVSLVGQTYAFSIGTLAPDERVRLTIVSRIRSTVNPPYVIVNGAVLAAGGQVLQQAEATVLSASTMPSTGESWLGGLRDVLLLAVGGTGAVVMRYAHRR